MIKTITGRVSDETLGMTLMHEHVLHQVSCSSGRPDNTCTEQDLMVEELRQFKAAGGDAICDLTPVGLGRDPEGLREVSRQSGVKIISGLGLYLEKDFPEDIRSLSEPKLADYIVQQAEGGVTGIPAGIIGEIASHHEDHDDWRRYRLTAREEEIFGAVAKAQKRTKLSISTHASTGRAGVAQVQALLRGGVDPQRVIVGHCDAQWHVAVEKDLDYYCCLLDEGVTLSFDLFGWEDLMPDEERYRRVKLLVKEGFSNRILLSTDTCRRSQLHRFGGRGFDYLFYSIIPGLRRTGVRDEELKRMLVHNPRRMLTTTS